MTPRIIFKPELRLADGTVLRSGDDVLIFLLSEKSRPRPNELKEILDLLTDGDDPLAADRASTLVRNWLSETDFLKRAPDVVS
jgi:hypothetical protein